MVGSAGKKDSVLKAVICGLIVPFAPDLGFRRFGFWLLRFESFYFLLAKYLVGSVVHWEGVGRVGVRSYYKRG